MGSRRRSAAQSIDLLGDGGVTLGRGVMVDVGVPIHLEKTPIALKGDEIGTNRHRALGFCLSMIFSESRCALFRIMHLGRNRSRITALTLTGVRRSLVGGGALLGMSA